LQDIGALQRVILKEASRGIRAHLRTGLTNASHAHTKMLCLHDDGNAARSKTLLERFGDVVG
jgi:hypothetical protein